MQRGDLSRPDPESSGRLAAARIHNGISIGLRDDRLGRQLGENRSGVLELQRDVPVVEYKTGIEALSSVTSTLLDRDSIIAVASHSPAGVPNLCRD